MSISDMDDVIDILRGILRDLDYESKDIDSILRENGYCPICYRSIEPPSCPCHEWNQSYSESELSDSSTLDDTDKD